MYMYLRVVLCTMFCADARRGLGVCSSRLLLCCAHVIRLYKVAHCCALLCCALLCCAMLSAVVLCFVVLYAH